MSNEQQWKCVDWSSINRECFQIQQQIYQASAQGDISRVHMLQKLAVRSFRFRLLAVRRVTQDNQGKQTAGIDGISNLSPSKRWLLATQLELDGKSDAIRRVYIPKPNGEQRPLGIPTIGDRAKQALALMALEPQWEATFEPNSYGFRPGRGCHDALQAIFLAIRAKPKFALDGDIRKCFDKIDHSKLLTLLDAPSFLHKQVKAWLEAGILDTSGEYIFPTQGTPQGGVISPLLCNIALHGMENLVYDFVEKLPGTKERNRSMVSCIRYADDFVILHPDNNVLLDIKEHLSLFLSERGLELHPEKTKIVHTLHSHKAIGSAKVEAGFKFLGTQIRQYHVGKHHRGKARNGQLLECKTIFLPHQDAIKLHKDKLRQQIQRLRGVPQEDLIRVLNPIIRGWSQYHSTVASKETFSSLDNYVFWLLWSWAKRRHRRKNKQWIKEKYWSTIEDNGISRNWVFGGFLDTRSVSCPENSVEVKSGEKSKRVLQLILHQEIPIKRHVKVRGIKSPYDGDTIYWTRRRGASPSVTPVVAKLIQRQHGLCQACKKPFLMTDLWHVDHKLPKSQGGRETLSNYQLLHKYCHEAKTHNERIEINDDNLGLLP